MIYVQILESAPFPSIYSVINVLHYTGVLEECDTIRVVPVQRTLVVLPCYLPLLAVNGWAHPFLHNAS